MRKLSLRDVEHLPKAPQLERNRIWVQAGLRSPKALPLPTVPPPGSAPDQLGQHLCSPGGRVLALLLRPRHSQDADPTAEQALPALPRPADHVQVLGPILLHVPPHPWFLRRASRVHRCSLLLVCTCPSRKSLPVTGLALGQPPIPTPASQSPLPLSPSTAFLAPFSLCVTSSRRHCQTTALGVLLD